jgi:hypothetical protein
MNIDINYIDVWGDVVRNPVLIGLPTILDINFRDFRLYV